MKSSIFWWLVYSTSLIVVVFSNSFAVACGAAVATACSIAAFAASEE